MGIRNVFSYLFYQRSGEPYKFYESFIIRELPELSIYFPVKTGKNDYNCIPENEILRDYIP